VSYSISIYGHGQPKAEVIATFDEAVRRLRAATRDGQSSINGSVSGSDVDGQSFSRTVEQVGDADEPDPVGS
jgi:hypothetical protein